MSNYQSDRRGTAFGFTLVELMITVSVIGIVALVAIPSMQALINANRLTGVSGEMSAALQMARSEATRRNTRVTVCESSDGTTCTGGKVWTRWIVRGEANARDTRETLRDDRAPGSVQISGPTSGVRFTPSGMVVSAESVTVCMPTTNPADNQRVLSVNLSGGVVSTKANGSGACP